MTDLAPNLDSCRTDKMSVLQLIPVAANVMVEYIQRVVLTGRVWLGRTIAEMGKPGKQKNKQEGNLRSSGMLSYHRRY